MDAAMAVAVKTNPDARPRETPSSPAVLGLLGVVYVVVSLALLFKIVPDMWWTVWNNLRIGNLELVKFPVIGGSLLVIFSVLLAMTLIGLGNRLLGPSPPVGVRGGVFVGFVGLLAIVLLTRWVSIGLERMAYADTITPLTGAILTGAVGGLLLLGFIRAFGQKWAQRYIVQFEEMGWFSTAAYKPTQGQRVRRATIFGILLLVGAGIYTMLHHNTLTRVGPDWALNIPFTGAHAIEGIGDTESLIQKLPPSATSNVQVRWPGARELRLSRGQVISLDTFKSKFTRGLQELHFSETTRAEFEDTKGLEPVEYVMKVNRFLYHEFEDLLAAKNDKGEPLLKADVIRRLRVLDNETEMADLTRLLEATAREVDLARGKAGASEDTAFLNLPGAVLLVDKFEMRKVYAETAKDKAIRIESAGNSEVFKNKVGEVVSKEDFDREVETMSSDRAKALGLVPPEGRELRQPYGPIVYANLTLLPSLQYTVPLLLILSAIWLAWRAVNIPAFADFLIATEGEMNKVSWTTQKKLVQDTTVVLATVFLMAVFLFVVDFGWKFILQPLGVLHIPKVGAEQQKQIEQKKW
jgi:preprotein translocase SecE subunit